MRHQGFAASKWARSLALSASIFFAIAALWGGPLGAGPLQVTGVTVGPDNVTIVSPGNRTCANYNSAVAAGVADTNQPPHLHAGMCRWAGLELLVEGVPLARYVREVSAGQRAAPFTRNPNAHWPNGLFCLQSHWP